MNIFNKSKPAHTILAHIEMVLTEISEDSMDGSRGVDRVFIPPGKSVTLPLGCVSHTHFYLLLFSLEILPPTHLRSNWTSWGPVTF